MNNDHWSLILNPQAAAPGKQYISPPSLQWTHFLLVLPQKKYSKFSNQERYAENVSKLIMLFSHISGNKFFCRGENFIFRWELNLED